MTDDEDGRFGQCSLRDLLFFLLGSRESELVKVERPSGTGAVGFRRVCVRKIEDRGEVERVGLGRVRRA